MYQKLLGELCGFWLGICLIFKQKEIIIIITEFFYCSLDDLIYNVQSRFKTEICIIHKYELYMSYNLCFYF